MPLQTATAFAWQCLSGGACLPPGAFGPDAVCWLCGGETGGIGWPLRDAIADTFTNHNLARRLDSRTICQACAALAHKDTWEDYVARHPDMGLKTGCTMSWRCYSHIFAAGLHACPFRQEWRRWLLEPPPPPFLFVMSTSGQKHLIFRGRVAHDRENFPLQVEDDSVLVERGTFAQCLAAFEALYASGFSKKSITTGRYHHGQLLKVGLAAWRPLEERMRPWRRLRPRYVDVCENIGWRPKIPSPIDTPTQSPRPQEETCTTTDSIPKTKPKQRRLFSSTPSIAAETDKSSR